MRGKVYGTSLHGQPHRITPAYAGKSSSNRRTGCGIWDHPRLCGEKSFSVELVSSGMGSPPPMRGKAHVKLIDGVDSRITPAYAGKRFS